MFAEIDGSPIIACVIAESASGRWYANVSVQTQTVAKKCTLKLGTQLELTGVLHEAELAYETFVCSMHGGAGDVGRFAVPQHYRAASVRTILTDLANTAGEQLSPDIDTGLLNQQVDVFTVMKLSVGSMLALLAQKLGKRWRFRRDGSLWLGDETWQPYQGVCQVALRSPLETMVELITDLDSSLIEPGCTFEGRKVTHVDHRFQDGVLRSRAFMEA